MLSRMMEGFALDEINIYALYKTCLAGLDTNVGLM
jgi:hypothetical protein